MPPKSSLTSSFSVSDASNEVVCPLRNQDGTACRKRCFGEKKYRSMQEHIRRAHPQHYISKLPATEESFNLMINTAPSERPLQPPPPPKPTTSSSSSNIHSSPTGHYDPTNYYSSPQRQQHQSQSSPVQAKQEVRRGSLLPAASAAAALAQLHNSRPENEWDHEQAMFAPGEVPHDDDQYLSNFFANDGTHDGSHDVFPENNRNAPRDYLAPGLQRTPSASNRASSLQPFPRGKPNRPRKSSVTENARRPKHERDRSKDFKRLSHERKAYSAEPQAMAALGSKRWEDLLDAAMSATEEDSRDLTPIPQSPRSTAPAYPASSLGVANQPGSYTASPLQNSILPRTPDRDTPGPAQPAAAAQVGNSMPAPPSHSAFSPSMHQPFPSVEAPPPSFDSQSTPQQPYHQHHHHQPSNDSTTSDMYATSYQRHNHHPSSSGSNFHLQNQGLSSSPEDRPHQPPHQTHHHPNNSNNSNTSAEIMNDSHGLSGLSRPGIGGVTHGLSHPSMYGPPNHHGPAHHDAVQRPVSRHSVASGSGGMPGGVPRAGAPAGYPLAPPASPPQVIQHYCAACRRLAALTASYACTECICGICRDCVDVLYGMGPNREAACPRCQAVGGRFKPFMLDLR